MGPRLRGDDMENLALRDNPQRLGAAGIQRQPPKIRVSRNRLIEHGAVAPPRHFDGAEAAQVPGNELGVEQYKSAGDQPRDQMHQRDFRGVAGIMKHALAEEGAAETDAVEPAGEIIAVPRLDAVTMPDLMQSGIEIADAAVDPGIVAAGGGR